MSAYGIDTILKLLPHRYPFLLIDRVLEAAEDGSHLVAIKNATFNEPFFQGHFPGQPIMPGVLHLEAIAQACGLMCLLAKTPGDQLRIETTLVHHKGRFGKASGKIIVEDKVATEATLSFMLIPRKAEQ